MTRRRDTRCCHFQPNLFVLVADAVGDVLSLTLEGAEVGIDLAGVLREGGLDGQVVQLRGSVDLGRLKPLPGTREELQSIARVMKDTGGEATLFLRGFATEKNMRESIRVRNATIIHLACHGLANRKVPSLSLLALSPEGDGMADATDGRMESMLGRNTVQSLVAIAMVTQFQAQPILLNQALLILPKDSATMTRTTDTMEIIGR